MIAQQLSTACLSLVESISWRRRCPSSSGFPPHSTVCTALHGSVRHGTVRLGPASSKVDPTAEEEAYDDVLCVLQLLNHLVTKDLVDQSDDEPSEKVITLVTKVTSDETSYRLVADQSRCRHDMAWLGFQGTCAIHDPKRPHAMKYV